MHKEIEKTYLAKFLPRNIYKGKAVNIDDKYIYSGVEGSIRLRKKGSEYILTKKGIVKPKRTASIQSEQNILLSKAEFDVFYELEGKSLSKTRYYYKYKETILEIDIFKDNLQGLVLIEREFNSKQELEAFEMPDFCLADVTEERFVAGNRLAGKKYSELERELTKCGYTRIDF